MTARRAVPPSWVTIGLGLVGLGLLGLLVPNHYEGRVLVPISPGHGLSFIDGLSLIPLLLGTGVVYWGIWNRRGILLSVANAELVRWSIGVFVCGLGLGLLIASAFSGFWWWWAIGALVVTVSLLVAIGVTLNY